MKSGQPKISDFGYCEIAGVKKPSMYYNVGSPSYMPPEAYIKNYYSEKSDVWAVGMIFYEMLKGCTLDRGMEVSEMYNFIRTGGRFIPPGISSQSERVLAECLKFDFNKRAGFKDLEKLIGIQQQQHQPVHIKPLIEHNDLGRSLNEVFKPKELGRPVLGSVKSFTENPPVLNTLLKQPLFDHHQPHPQRLINVSTNRQVGKGKRVVETYPDNLNITDPCINQSMLSDNARQKVNPVDRSKQPILGSLVN
mgnify:CR=1 FL=1